MVKILKRVADKHPEMVDKEVLSAWKCRLKTQFRLDGDKPYAVAIGISTKGRLIEIIAFEDDGEMIIFHAMKASRKMMDELGIV